jgi:hypothetical protein
MNTTPRGHSSAIGIKNGDVQAIRTLSVDFDGGLPAVADYHLKPALVIQTSMKDGVQRGQALWPIEPVVGDTAALKPVFGEAQKRLAAHYGGDTQITDLRRVHRLPGNLHLKGEPHS